MGGNGFLNAINFSVSGLEHSWLQRNFTSLSAFDFKGDLGSNCEDEATQYLKFFVIISGQTTSQHL